MIVKNICTNFARKTQTMRNGAANRKAVVERASKIYHYSPTKTRIAKATNSVTGYVAPVIKKVKSESPTISAISEGCSAIKQGVANAKKAPANQGASAIKTTLQGIKDSSEAIKNSLANIAGINDVKMAKQQAGTSRAVLEGGKSALRLIASSALSAACLPLPIPGAMIGGWFAGEKLVETIVGKPFSKQIAKQLTKLK